MRPRLLLRFSVLARRDEGAYPQRSVTEEQRSQNRKAKQPSGRRFFLAQTSLLTPYRPLEGMLVARASSGPKKPRRKRGRIYGTWYLGKKRADSRRPPLGPRRAAFPDHYPVG